MTFRTLEVYKPKDPFYGNFGSITPYAVLCSTSKPVAGLLMASRHPLVSIAAFYHLRVLLVPISYSQSRGFSTILAKILSRFCQDSARFWWPKTLDYRSVFTFQRIGILWRIAWESTLESILRFCAIPILEDSEPIFVFFSPLESCQNLLAESPRILLLWL